MEFLTVVLEVFIADLGGLFLSDLLGGIAIFEEEGLDLLLGVINFLGFDYC